MKNISVLIILIMLAFTVESYAEMGLPRDYLVGNTGITEAGNKFQLFVVNCNNGKKYAITKWMATKNFCLGSDGISLCSKHHKQVAKKACKGNTGIRTVSVITDTNQ